MSTISALEVLWVVICLSGVWHHGRQWRRIQSQITALEAGRLTVSPGAMALWRNDAGVDADMCGIFATLTLIGLVDMTLPAYPATAQGLAVTAALFGMVLFSRARSEVRARNRVRYIERGSA